MAKAYVACVEARMDMRRYVSPSLAYRLTAVAKERVIPVETMKLLALPDVGIDRLGSLPKIDQKKLFDDGAQVWRGNRVQTVMPTELTAGEFRALIDTRDGARGRVRSPEEQQSVRVVRVAGTRKDRAVWFTPEEGKALDDWALRRGKPAHRAIVEMLKSEGFLGK